MPDTALPEIHNPLGGSVKPAEPEIVFDAMLITGVQLDLNPDWPAEKQFLRVIYWDYNFDLKLRNVAKGPQTFTIYDPWAEKDRVPMLAQWMGLGAVQLFPLAIDEREKTRLLAAAELSHSQAAAQLATAQARFAVLPDEITAAGEDAELVALLEAELAGLPAQIGALEPTVTALADAVTAAQGALATVQAQLGMGG